MAEKKSPAKAEKKPAASQSAHAALVKRVGALEDKVAYMARSLSIDLDGE